MINEDIKILGDVLIRISVATGILIVCIIELFRPLIDRIKHKRRIRKSTYKLTSKDVEIHGK